MGKSLLNYSLIAVLGAVLMPWEDGFETGWWKTAPKLVLLRYLAQRIYARESWVWLEQG